MLLLRLLNLLGQQSLVSYLAMAWLTFCVVKLNGARAAQGLAGALALCTLPECLTRLDDICRRLFDLRLVSVPLAPGEPHTDTAICEAAQWTMAAEVHSHSNVSGASTYGTYVVIQKPLIDFTRGSGPLLQPRP